MLLATTPAGATEFWVDGLDGSDANDGLTVATAKKTIQGGLSLATSAGDVVNVLPAEYNSPFFVMADGVTVRGIGEVVVTAGNSDTNNHSDVVIQDLTFRNNNAGLAISGATTRGNLVENCRFIQCNSGIRGFTGAIFKVRNCLFAHCEIGITTGVSSYVFEKNTFFDNELGISTGANTVVRDSAFVQNTRGVDNFVGTALLVHFSNFFGNTTDVTGVTTIVDGNFDDPLFIDAASDVFFVKAGSPLLDHGEFDMRIGAFGQGFHTSNDVTKDEPAQAPVVGR
ncbi:MAG: right-handed parallel beta-helix repeat-containing protein, partial [Planctomycetes bacterium]|nr:right-handed parallel beta-helix repeat-containing protein [Planctomycetota bacterium]